jgi:hypothetical protein
MPSPRRLGAKSMSMGEDVLRVILAGFVPHRLVPVAVRHADGLVPYGRADVR